MSFSTIMSRAGRLLSDNSPAILTGMAIAGTIGTAYLAGTAAYKVSKILEEEEELGGIADGGRERTRDLVRLVAPLFIPAIGAGVATIACILAANRISDRRAAAMAMAYGVSERVFKEYKDKVIEKVGERKERAYHDEIAQERVNRNPAPEDLVLMEEGLSVLCCDLFSGRYLMSDMETLRRAENDINYQVNHDYCASLSDFYDRIGLPRTSMSDDFGWNADKMLEITFSTVLTPSGKPCLTFDFRVQPIRGYSRLQ